MMFCFPPLFSVFHHFIVMALPRMNIIKLHYTLCKRAVRVPVRLRREEHAVEGNVGSGWHDRDGWNSVGFEKAMFRRPSPVALFSAEGMGVLCTNVPGRGLPAVIRIQICFYESTRRNRASTGRTGRKGTCLCTAFTARAATGARGAAG